MSRPYAREVRKAAIVVGYLDDDCQRGDPNACIEGLREASTILDLIVDGLDGVDPNE
jgi:hypothetical protein